MRSPTIRFLLCLSLLVVVGLYPRTSEACGFVSPGPLLPTEQPSAAHEDVLIVYDDARQTEHFIRRIRFDRAGKAFGFIVPTPSVASVEEASEEIWTRLREDCPHRFAEPLGLQGFGSGVGTLGRGAGPAVRILHQEKLGDFTAFVLAASDTDAFDAWLKANGFSATEAGRAWLDRYVKAGFHYVALRYDGAEESAERDLLSKTVRISFETPVPFYPYREPEDVQPDAERKLSLWFVGERLRVPVASVGEGDARRLRRPWSEAKPCRGPARDALVEVLDTKVAAAIPIGATIQTFADVKEHRHGWGDVLLTPVEPIACDAACVTASLPLSSLLAPEVAAAPPADPTELALTAAPVASAAPAASESVKTAPAPSAAPTTPTPNGSACAFSLGTGSEGWSLLLVAMALLGLRRRGALLAVLLAACNPTPDAGTSSSSPSSSSPSSPSSSSSATSTSSPSTSASTPAPVPAQLDELTLPDDPAEARESVLALLAGHRSGQLVEVWSRPGEGGLGAIDLPLPEPLPSRAEVQRLCVKDPRFEGVLHFRVSYHDGTAREAEVTGAAPEAIRRCVTRLLLETIWPQGEGRDADHLEVGAYGVGPLDPSLAPHRKRVHAIERSERRLRGPKIEADPGLPPEVVRRIVRTQFGRLRACAELAGPLRPDDERKAIVTFIIGGDGEVTFRRAAGPFPREALACLEEAFGRLRFPQPADGRKVEVKYPVQFEPAAAK